MTSKTEISFSKTTNSCFCNMRCKFFQGIVTFDGREEVDDKERKSCFKMQTIGLGLQQTQSKIIG